MKLLNFVLGTWLSIFAITLDASAQTLPRSVTPPAMSPRISQPIDEADAVPLKGNVHPLARPEFDQGPVDDATLMNRMLLVLQKSPEQRAALQELMQEQLSKDSPNFHKWLTPKQFGQQFGPADADMEAVSSWLAAHGFHHIKPANGRTTIEFSGSVRQVREAFHTEIHHFLVHGEVHQANVGDPQIPAALAPAVVGIASLNDFTSKSMRHEVGAFTKTTDGSVVPQFTGASGAFYALGPADFAKIYNVPSSPNGTGSKIAIVGVSDINVQDVSNFRSLFALPANPPNIVHNGPDPGVNGGEGEADLDVEWSGAVAPGAQIDYVVSEGTLTADPIVLSALYVIDNNSDDILSVSFGNCEPNLGTAGNALFQQLWEQAAAQGITVTVSAGDAGSAGCDDFHSETAATLGLAISGFASTPFNIAVGGTDFDDNGRQSSFWNTTNAASTFESALGYVPETSWNDSCAAAALASNLSTICASPQGILAGSGGRSGINAAPFVGHPKPSFQNGLTPVDGARDIPDISLFASTGALSKSFYVVCQADRIPAGNPPSCAPTTQGGPFSFLGVGGTSASAPGFAGILALIEQSERTRVPGSTGRQGNANFVLYELAASASNFCNSTTQPLSPPASCVFYDITKGNNSVPCAGGSLNCSDSTSGTFGVLVDPANTTNPAWTTATHYDYATGLGSVNVANLISKWGGAVGAFKATTANLKLNGGTNTINIPHGTSVTAAVTVAANSGTGTPTGDVSLSAPSSVGANEGGTGGTLSGGAANFTTKTLPGGSYTVTAHYAGDGTFAPSDSNGVPVVVAKESSGLQAGIVTFDPTTGKVTSTNATSFPYGSPYILRFDILNSSGNPCQPLSSGGTTTGCAFDATGSVTITDNGTPLDQGTFPLNSEGHGEDQPIQLVPGTHPIALSYSGDNSYAASGPTNLSLTVGRAATTTNLTIPPGIYAVRGSVPFTSTVTTQSSGVPPSCTSIVYMDGSTVVNSGGDCTFSRSGGVTTVGLVAGSFTPLTPGVHTYTATYPQDTYYATSTSSPVSVTVKLASSLSVTANPVQVVLGQSTTLTALVDTGNLAPTPGPTGTVQFSGFFAGKIGNPVNCTPTTDPFGNEACQASIVFSPTTTDNVTATYSGDANYAPFNGAGNISVIVVPPSFAISGSSTTVTAGQTGTSTVTVTPTGFTGTVTVACQTLPGVTCSQLTINETNANAPATGALTINVAGPSSTTTASLLPADRIYVAQTPQAAGQPWRSWGGGAGLAVLILLFVPRRRTRTAVPLGLIWALSFTVSCGGGGSNGPPPPPPPTATTTQLSVSSTKVAANGSITVSATVSGGTPTGNVQFFVDGAAVGSPVPVSNGTTGNITVTAASAPAFLAIVGTHSVSANYLGSMTTQSSHSGTLSVTVTGTTSLAITGTSTATSANGSISLTVN